MDEACWPTIEDEFLIRVETKRAVLRMAAKAPVEGCPHQEFCGEFRKYLDNG